MFHQKGTYLPDNQENTLAISCSGFNIWVTNQMVLFSRRQQRFFEIWTVNRERDCQVATNKIKSHWLLRNKWYETNHIDFFLLIRIRPRKLQRIQFLKSPGRLWITKPKDLLRVYLKRLPISCAKHKDLMDLCKTYTATHVFVRSPSWTSQ